MGGREEGSGQGVSCGVHLGGARRNEDGGTCTVNFVGTLNYIRPKLKPSLGSLPDGKVRVSVFLPTNLTVSGPVCPLPRGQQVICVEIFIIHSWSKLGS